MHYSGHVIKTNAKPGFQGWQNNARKLANGLTCIGFETDPSRYRHWKLSVDGDVATLAMDVDENGGLFEGYLLKLNSYDLGVDIESSPTRCSDCASSIPR